MKWIKDQKVEANLRKLKVDFEIGTGIPWSRIDLAEGIRRQKRLINKLDESTVISWAIKMAEPEAAFPMPILQKPPHGLLWVWSGNHRLASYALAFPDTPPIDAYLVTIRDPVMLDLLPRVVNTWESQLGYSKDEKIASALWMMETHSMKAAEAAAHFGLKVEWLYKSAAAEEVRAAVIDIKGSDKIPKSIYERIHSLVASNQTVVRSLVRLLINYNVKSSEALHIINDVKKQTTENKMLGELGRWEDIFKARAEPKKRAKGTVSMTRSTREIFLKQVTALAKTCSEKDSATKLQITDPVDFSLVKSSWQIINHVLTKVMQEGTPNG